MQKKFYLILSILWLTFCSPLSAGGNIALLWNKTTLNAIADTNTSPPIAARSLAIVHTAIYDTWAVYDEKAFCTTYSNLLKQLGDEHDIEKAISFAAYRTLVDLFPSEKHLFDENMELLGYDPFDSKTDLKTPSGIGNTIGLKVLNLRKNDGSNQFGNEPNSNGPYSDYTGYKPVNTYEDLIDPSRWQPLKVGNTIQSFLLPFWGLVTPFSLSDGAQFLPKPPAQFLSLGYNKQAIEILKLSADLDDRTKSIAEYWADGGGTATPPGHWNKIARFISKRDNHTLDDDVQMFFLLNNALFDASISVWYIKRHYDYIRPISAIRFLYKDKEVLAWAGPGKGSQLIKGETWQSYIPTPPFPSYISGHSTFSAAAAEILRRFTESDNYGRSVVIEKGSSKIEKDVPSEDITLTWPTFTDAADEAGMSRRYGGIHFKDDDLEGRKIGRRIAKLAYEKGLFYIEGNSK